MSPFMAYDNILYPVGYFVNPYFKLLPYTFTKHKAKPSSIGFHLPPNFEVEDEKISIYNTFW